MRICKRVIDIEPIAFYPDNFPRVEELIVELKQRGGEDWACGEILERCLNIAKERPPRSIKYPHEVAQE